MIIVRSAFLLASMLAGALAAAQPPVTSSQDALGPLRSAPAQKAPRAARAQPDDSTLAWVLHWNDIAIDASGLDHTPLEPDERRVFGENLGPGRASRAMAIVHVALFEAMNAIAGGYRSYTGMQRAPRDASLRAAIARSAHDTLAAMFPSQKPAFDRELQLALGRLPPDDATAAGIDVGAEAARRILSKRAGDGAQHAEPRMGEGFVSSRKPGWWRQDPISLVPIAMGAHWGRVQPFVLRTAGQFRVPPPPSMESEEYAVAFEEVQRLGGDGIHTPTQRTAEQTFIGIFWAYDGTPSLCAPPRLYNQLTTTIARSKGSSAMEVARLLALTNVAMSDAGVAIWESKFHYQFWRPITAIRESDPGTGPTGSGDGNLHTAGDPAFTPLGAPASNLTGPNFTPPFPSYPSGHAGFGGALFQTLRRFYRTDNIAFTFVSDEYNGVTTDNEGQVRPNTPRHFTSLSQAEEENGQSRIYLGIHWSFDKTEGITQGQQVADYIYERLFTPVQN